MTPHLLGVAEIAAMLGITRQRVNQLIQSADFPAPEAELSAGRIWTREAIETWVAAHPDRTNETAGAMFASFAPTSRKVIIRAQEESRTLLHSYIGTEHLLLAVLSDAAPAVRQRMAAIGIERDGILADVVERCPAGPQALTGHIPFTPRSRTILTRAVAIAGGRAVEPHHIARSVVGLADGYAAEFLRKRLGLEQDELVAEVDRVLGDPGREALVTGASSEDGPLECSFCGQGQDDVKKLIAGPGMSICDQCVDLCNKIIGGELDPGRKRLAERIDQLAADLDRLRRDFEAGA